MLQNFGWCRVRVCFCLYCFCCYWLNHDPLVVSDQTLFTNSSGLGINTASYATLDLAKEWYTTCKSCHDRCKIPLALDAHTNWQPTRLIDIAPRNDDDWKLCTSPSSRGSVRYMTLSYRWSSKTSLKLLRGNKDQLVQGFPISRLPQTFQDAIKVARHFSINFIWIDALCIVQNSPEDWARESATMRYVYSHSACNIAASAAIEQESGMFRPRCFNQIQPRVVRSKSYIQSDHHIPHQSYLLYDKRYWDRQLAGPLNNRGWVFQECLLAPRILYFGVNQILYDCFHETKSEGFPQSIPFHERMKDLSDLWTDLDSQKARLLPTTQMPAEMPLGMHALWNSLLEMYSFCRLSFIEDRLPAFSGVAQLFENATGDEYIDGLWRSRLVEQLVWWVPGPKFPRRMSNVPSWSWASLEEEIQTVALPAEWKSLVEVREVRPLERYQHSSNPSSVPSPCASLALAGVLSVSRHSKEAAHDRVRHVGPRDVKTTWFPDNATSKLATDSYFLPVLTSHPWYPPQPGITRVVGLVLASCIGASGDCYRRIGQFTTDSIEVIEQLGLDVDNSSIVQGLASFKNPKSTVCIAIM